MTKISLKDLTEHLYQKILTVAKVTSPVKLKPTEPDTLETWEND